jgi:hypothetical protein
MGATSHFSEEKQPRNLLKPLTNIAVEFSMFVMKMVPDAVSKILVLVSAILPPLLQFYFYKYSGVGKLMPGLPPPPLVPMVVT